MAYSAYFISIIQMEIKLNTNSSQSQRELPLRQIDKTHEDLLRPNQKGKRIKKMENLEQSKSSQSSKDSGALKKKSLDQRIQRMSRIKARVAGFGLFIIIVGILFAYGFGSSINTGYFGSSHHFLVGITLFVSFIFVVIGFGLFLGYYVQNLFTAIFTAVYVVSITVIISPLLQKLWLNIFLNGFNDGLNSPTAGFQVLFNSNSTSNVSVNYSNIKLSICCAISQLLMHIAVIGRVQIYKSIFVSVVFIIFWNINYFLCIAVFKLSPDSRFFDDYSISMVYIFGGFVALLVSLDVPSNLHLKRIDRPQKSYPKIASFLGIFFIWLSFCCTFSITGTKQSSSKISDQIRTIFYPEGCLQMFFALSASTVSTLAFSYLMNSKPRAIDLLNGSISGAILFGSIAGFTTNIAVPIAVGIFSAFISALYKSKIMVKLNKAHAYDMLGLFGPFLINAIFGAVVLAPIVLRTFIDYAIVTLPMNGSSITVANETGWILVYPGISTGIGLIAGMVISTIVRCCTGNQKRFGDNLLFIQNLNVEEKDLDYTEEKTILQE